MTEQPVPAQPARPVRRAPDAVIPAGETRASAYVCEAVSCLSTQSHEVLLAIGEGVADGGLTDIAVKRVGCLGL